MEDSISKHLIFSLDRFDDWKLRMQTHLYALHNKMWDVITNRSVKIWMVNLAWSTLNPDAPRYLEKSYQEWTNENRKRNNFDNIAKDILFKVVDETIFPKIHKLELTKEI